MGSQKILERKWDKIFENMRAEIFQNLVENINYKRAQQMQSKGTQIRTYLDTYNQTAENQKKKMYVIKTELYK